MKAPDQLRDPYPGPKPLHGSCRRRQILTFCRQEEQVFPSPNGEGEIVIPQAYKVRYQERWCRHCNDWRAIVGIVAYFQAKYVGCDKCGRPYRVAT